MPKIYFTKTAVVGEFRVGTIQSGKHGRRLKLCSIEEFEFKISKDGRKIVRSAREKARLVDELYNSRLKEALLEEQLKEEEKPNSEYVEVLMGTWLEEVKAFGDKGKRTYTDYKKSVEYYINSVGNHPITDFEKEYNNIYVTWLTKKGLSRNTIHKHFRNIQTFYYWAEDNDHCHLIKLKKPKKTKKEPRTLSTKQLQKVEAELRERFETAGNRLYKLGYKNLLRAFVMMCETAMRGGEIWSIRLEDIDLENLKIYIVDHESEQWFVKAEHEETMPIFDYLAKFLKEDLKNRNENEIWYLDDGKGNKFYKNVTTLGKPIRRIYQQFGFNGVRPLHGIRASVITNLLLDGFSLVWVQKFARHRDIATTRGYFDSIRLEITNNNNTEWHSGATKMPLNPATFSILQQN